MFSNLRYIYEVYKESSFSKAAQNLYISQPSLSAVVKRTENKVGVPLFDRSTNPIRLTEAGKEYIKVAEKIMDLEEGYAGYVGSLNGLKTGRIRIGGTYLYSVFVLPTTIYRFHEMYPNIQIDVIEGHTDQLEEMLSEGELDLIVDNYPMDSVIYEKKFLCKERILLAVPASYKSNEPAKKWSLTAQDIMDDRHYDPKVPGVPLSIFSEDPFVVLRIHNDTRSRVDKICKRVGFNPKISLKLDQMMMTYRLTEQQKGAAFVSDTVVKNQTPTDQVVYYKIDDPAAEREVNFYYKRSKYFTKAMGEFITLAGEMQ